MSVEAAVGVGAAIGSAQVTSMAATAGFHDERIELLQSEVDGFRDAVGRMGDAGSEDEA